VRVCERSTPLDRPNRPLPRPNYRVCAILPPGCPRWRRWQNEAEARVHGSVFNIRSLRRLALARQPRTGRVAGHRHPSVSSEEEEQGGASPTQQAAPAPKEGIRSYVDTLNATLTKRGRATRTRQRSRSAPKPCCASRQRSRCTPRRRSICRRSARRGGNTGTSRRSRTAVNRSAEPRGDPSTDVGHAARNVPRGVDLVSSRCSPQRWRSRRARRSACPGGSACSRHHRSRVPAGALMAQRLVPPEPCHAHEARTRP